MNGHLDQLIDDYLDGELQHTQKRQVQAHLASCPACQELLAQRRSLSDLLQEPPQASGLKPISRFAAEVGLLLNKAPQSGLTPFQQARRLAGDGRIQSLGWLAIPLTLLAASAFIQAVWLLSEFLELAPGPHQVWMQQLSLAQPTSTLLLPEPWSAALSGIGWVNLLQWNWLTGLMALAGIGLLYLAWLVGWLARSQAPGSAWQVE